MINVLPTRATTQAGNIASDQSSDFLARYRLYRLGLAYGRHIYRWRGLILLFWLIVLGITVPFATQLPAHLSGGDYSFQGSESTVVSNTLTRTLHQPLSQAIIVFQSRAMMVSDPAFQWEVQSVLLQLPFFPHYAGMTVGGVGKDGHTMFVLVNFNATSDTLQPYMGQLRSLLPESNGVSTYLTGHPAVTDEMNTQIVEDAERADSVVFPVALLLLLLIFGTFTAALLPLLLALITISLSLALLYPLALHTTLSSFILNITSIIGLGISIDYSLLIVRRFREELARGRNVQEAVAWTLATAGEAILFSGLTVMIGFGGMTLIGMSEGIGGAFVVSVAVLVALTLLPAFLGILGSWINSFRLPWLWRFSLISAENGQKEEEGFWHRLALSVMRRPIAIILLVCCILLALGWPVFSLRVGIDTATALPASSQARQGLAILRQQFPGVDQNPLDLIIRTGDGSKIMTPENLARLANLDQWLIRQQHITDISGLLQPASTGSPTWSQQQLIKLYTTGAYQQIPALRQLATSTTSGNLTWIRLNTDTALNSDPAIALVDHLRAVAGKENPGLTVQIGGGQAVYEDLNNYLYSYFPHAIIFILIVTYVLLLLMFRSVLIPLKAVIMNVLSISAAYGVLVFVFQWGHLSTVLNFTSEGFVNSLIPILMFSLLFGLSMDYEVFLLSRIREEWLRTGDNTGAVALGLEKTGGVITNAALLFLIVTIAFTLTTLTITKEIGLGMTVALLVDATIIRSLLVPATMRLLGRWNWWLPGRKWTQKRPESSSGNHAGGQKDKILEEFKPKQPESSSKDHTRAPKDRALKGFKHLPL